MRKCYQVVSLPEESYFFFRLLIQRKPRREGCSLPPRGRAPTPPRTRSGSPGPPRPPGVPRFWPTRRSRRTLWRRRGPTLRASPPIRGLRGRSRRGASRRPSRKTAVPRVSPGTHAERREDAASLIRHPLRQRVEGGEPLRETGAGVLQGAGGRRRGVTFGDALDLLPDGVLVAAVSATASQGIVDRAGLQAAQGEARAGLAGGEGPGPAAPASLLHARYRKDKLRGGRDEDAGVHRPVLFEANELVAFEDQNRVRTPARDAKLRDAPSTSSTRNEPSSRASSRSRIPSSTGGPPRSGNKCKGPWETGSPTRSVLNVSDKISSMSVAFP